MFFSYAIKATNLRIFEMKWTDGLQTYFKQGLTLVVAYKFKYYT